MKLLFFYPVVNITRVPVNSCVGCPFSLAPFIWAHQTVGNYLSRSLLQRHVTCRMRRMLLFNTYTVRAKRQRLSPTSSYILHLKKCRLFEVIWNLRNSCFLDHLCNTMLVLIRGTHITDVHISAYLFVGERQALSTREVCCNCSHHSWEERTMHCDKQEQECHPASRKPFWLPDLHYREVTRSPYSLSKPSHAYLN